MKLLSVSNKANVWLDILHTANDYVNDWLSEAANVLSKLPWIGPISFVTAYWNNVGTQMGAIEAAGWVWKVR